LVEKLNTTALKLAREVINEFPDHELFLAGNICNTTIYDPTNPDVVKECREMFVEQLQWAKDAGVDFIIAETYSFIGEALLALEVIKSFGLPAVVTMDFHQDNMTRDGKNIVDSLMALSEAGAAVVGLNCAKGPKTMIKLFKEFAGKIPTPLACLPCGYDTNEQFPTFQSFSTRDRKYTDIDGHTCTRYDFEEFGKECAALGLKYIGTCCGGGPHHVRAIAEALGRKPIASKFSPDLSLHFAFGQKESFTVNTTDNTVSANFKYGEIM